MSTRRPPHRVLAPAAACLLAVTTAVIATDGGPPAASAATVTTAWHNGAFAVDRGGVVSRSDIVLGQPNMADSQFMPLGNGSLGVAAWAANGFTAQLNRSDTMPYRLSPGQIEIPGLSAMTSASNFKGTLDLYNGRLDESGGGMTMQAWVPAGKDELIVNVRGASPGTTETADLHLWSGRSPSAAASGAIGTLAQTWVDNSQSGSSGQTFGAMAGITAGGQNVTASVVNSTEVQVSFNPNSDGSFRVIVAAPKWTGGDPAATTAALVGGDTTAATSSLLATQSAWWHKYWAHTGLVELDSSDGTAQYLENLRTIYLYAEAASIHGGDYPGSQAGVADMFAYDQDQQDWYPAGYWLWNLRGQIAANLSAGRFSLNLPIFDMYLADLPAIESWTRAQMGGKAGACVPETMRFNGNGYYNGGNTSQNASCALASNPSYNAETVTSGAEIALWIWHQYQETTRLAFLRKYYPVMRQAATFLLAYQSVGSDAYLHAVANAHETQWSVPDPTTDMASDQALFPATIRAATLLKTDASLVSQLRTAVKEIGPYARTDEATRQQLLNPQPTSAASTAAVDAQGNDVIANSFQPSAALHNGENIGMEPVWPYGVIGDSTVVGGDNLTALADRTYDSRPNQNNPDWSFDAVDAARLDMPGQLAADLTTNTEHYQAYICGLANLFNATPGDEPYIEQSSTVATAIDEALATDYDGVLRIAPAWPSGWDASGTVYIQSGSKVDVQVEGGVIATAAIQAGTTRTMTVRNPWPGQQAEVVNGSTSAVVVSPTSATTFGIPVKAGDSYLIEQPASPTTSLPFAQVTGTKATSAKHLGSEQIGLDAASGSSGATTTIATANTRIPSRTSATEATSAAANPASVSWTGTWATAPEGGGDTFDGQTIRQIVHTSISGTDARLRLSNAFGTAPLTVSDVHIARAGPGSAIVTGTDHRVTFGGSGTVTIPAGGTRTSQTIGLAVPALTDIAITFYLPDNTGASTYHQFSMSTTYIASGDVSGAASLPSAQTENNYYFLSSLEVQNAKSLGSVVALGASITDGYASTVDGNNRWTDVLASRLNTAGKTIGVLNEGISGNRLLVDGSGPSAIHRFDRDVLGQPGVRWVIFSDDPINDLGSTSPQPAAAQLIAGIRELITMAHRHSIKFICSTLTPYQGAFYWNQSGENAREAVNSWIRGGHNGCNGVIDQDGATHNPADPTWYLPAYDSGDHLHPNDAGYQAIGDAANLGLFTP
ncbi:MAG TPA: SGNH/GDSL hydrolase family protein [Streptosporangiaceae bacterium]|nr:SGNH/GDSL hydrolase family protein [Streptosporangiaceae bacterium]